ncbi:MAG: HDOD domain-containing protein [Victivallales bacterium]|nr:HDOD domain-containing protein [Victivallales bacterium]
MNYTFRHDLKSKEQYMGFIDWVVNRVKPRPGKVKRTIGNEKSEDTGITQESDPAADNTAAMNTNVYDSIVDVDYWWCFPGHYQPDKPLQDFVDIDTAVLRLRQEMAIQKFPLMDIPANILNVFKILEAPNFAYSEITALVEHSPAMTGEFLKVVNSASMNRGEKIHNLHVALTRLGREKIKSILYLYAAKLNFKTAPLFLNVVEEIIDHSYATGIIAAYLSQKLGQDQEEAFLAGLLHDIGKIATLRAMAVVCELPEKVDYELTQEYFNVIFNVLHEDVGAYISDTWRLGGQIRTAIAHHNNMEFSEEHDENAIALTSLVNLSDTMARVAGKGRMIGSVNIFDLQSTQLLGLTKNWANVEFLEAVPGLLKFNTKA